MKIIIDEVDKNFFIYEHRGKKLPFEVRNYSSKSDDLFRDINQYYAWRSSIKCIEEQDNIFEELEKVYHTLNNINDPHVIHRRLTNSVKVISKNLPLSLVRLWMDNTRGEYRSRIRHPTNLKKEIAEGEYVDQTYLEDEYYELAAFSIATKMLVPIWGSYLSFLKDINDIDRDCIALSILNSSTYVQEEAYKRLEVFCDCIASKDTSDLSIAGILNAGLSNGIKPKYLLATGILTKVAISPLSHEDDNDENTINLIANLFTQLQHKINQIESKKNNRVRDKKLNGDDNSSDEDNLSIAEHYKPKTVLNDATLATFDYYLEDLNKRAQMVKEDIDLDHLKEMYDLNISRKHFNPLEAQLEMVGLITRRCDISPRIVPYTNRPGSIGLFSIAQVACYEWGFAFISELLTAERMELCNKIGRVHIRDELRQRLEESYRYSRTYKTEMSSKITKRTPGLIAVNAITDTFRPYYWKTQVNNKIASASSLISGSDNLHRKCPDDIVNLIGDFILHIRSL